MILSPFDIDQLGPIAALIPPRIPEPPVLAQNVFATRMAAMGRPGPFTVRAPSDPVIVDRDGEPFEQIFGVTSPGDRLAAATIACIALNRLCGFPDVPLMIGDPIEAAALAIAIQAGRSAAAAE